MSRRDTILITVLVNAGLLLVLFATAMRSDKEPAQTNMQLAQTPQPAVDNPITLAPTLTEGESIDSLLNQFASIPTLSDAPTEEILFSNDLPAPALSEEAHSSSSVAQVPTQSRAPVTQPSQEGLLTVTVKKGDVLEKIAKAHGTSVAALMKANQLSSTSLKIGQVLKVPGKERESNPSKEALASASDYYVVKEGDSPWLIASKNNVKLDELLRLNNLDEQKARRLRPGDRLRIR